MVDREDNAIMQFYIEAFNALIRDERLIIFDPKHKSLKLIQSVCMNGGDIQLNAESWEEENE